jgi:hypothetical protein
MFRLEGVIIRLFVNIYHRYIKYSAYFGIPKSLNLKIQVELLQFYCLNELYCKNKCKGKGKAIPLQAWTGPEGSRRLRFPDFKTIGT